METFQIPRRRVKEYFGIARSTLYRWLHKIEDHEHSPAEPANKTPLEIAALIWEITKANVNWGKLRISNQLALLNIFISASTVRNILKRSKPRKGSPFGSIAKGSEGKKKYRKIPARPVRPRCGSQTLWQTRHCRRSPSATTSAVVRRRKSR